MTIVTIFTHPLTSAFYAGESEELVTMITITELKNQKCDHCDDCDDFPLIAKFQIPTGDFMGK